MFRILADIARGVFRAIGPSLLRAVVGISSAVLASAFPGIRGILTRLGVSVAFA